MSPYGLLTGPETATTCGGCARGRGGSTVVAARGTDASGPGSFWVRRESQTPCSGCR
jgi:hypothetical protein